MPRPVIFITVGMLIVAVAPWPYGYFTLLRLVATSAFVWAAFISYEGKHNVLPWVCAFLALLFNPFIPIHLDKSMWAPIDIAAGVFLLVNIKKLGLTPS